MGVTSAFVRKRNGITNGVVKFDGGTRSRSFGRVTSVEATLMLADFIREVERGYCITISDLLSSYISSLDVEPSTVLDYQCSAVAWSAEIGGLSAHSATQTDIQTVVSRWQASGRVPTTVRKRLRLLSAAYRHHVALGTVERDPTVGISPRRSAKEPPNALVGAELDRLSRDLTSPEPSFVTVGASLALWAGLRESEVCAMAVSDVDLRRGTVTVRHALGTGPDGEYVKVPKSRRRRSIPISSPLASVLAPWVASMPPEAFLIGPSPSKWRSKWSLSSSWRSFAERGGYVGTEGRRPTFHDLRHTFATSLVASGVDIKAVQALMGHASAAMTLDTYAAFDVGRMPQLGREMDAIFGN